MLCTDLCRITKCTIGNLERFNKGTSVVPLGELLKVLDHYNSVSYKMELQELFKQASKDPYLSSHSFIHVTGSSTEMSLHTPVRLIRPITLLTIQELDLGQVLMPRTAVELDCY